MGVKHLWRFQRRSRHISKTSTSAANYRGKKDALISVTIVTHKKPD